MGKRLAGWLTMARFCVCKIMKNVFELFWLLPGEKPDLPHSMFIQLDVPSVYNASLKRILNCMLSGWLRRNNTVILRKTMQPTACVIETTLLIMG